MCDLFGKSDNAHNIPTHIKASAAANARRKKRKKLMELVDRKQGKSRSKDWYEYTLC